MAHLDAHHYPPDHLRYLADRVLDMTSRPGTVKKWIDVDISRPRDIHVKVSDRFRELREEAMEAVHEEARKAFKRGERELAS